MNYACPLCLADLKGARLRKIPRPGESRFLAMRWHLECPRCSGELMQNQHPNERQVLPWLFTFVVLFNGIGWMAGYRASGTVFLAVLVSMFFGAYAIPYFTVPKDWQRYVIWKEPQT